MCKFTGLGLFALTVALLGAQEAESRLTRLKNLHLPESPGSVPVMYSPLAKERALEYQDELQNATTWFEEQLRIRVDMVLAVLDRDEFNAEFGHWPVPHSSSRFTPGIIYLPSRLEDQVGPEPQAKVPGQYIVYHEAGHIFAARLKINSGNSFVNELIANLFMAAYIRERRPDLQWVLEGPSPSRFEQTQRYTSLADLDYIYTGVGAQNYGWFQKHLQRIANFVLAGQKFPIVIDLLKNEFPAIAQKQETLDQIIVHLDRIRPGVKDMLGTLAGPTTLPLLRPSVCTESAGAALRSSMVIRNNTANPLSVIVPQQANAIVAARSWSSLQVRAGDSIRLPDGTCVVAADEPALAIIDR